MTSLLGGPSDLIENYDSHFTKAPVIRPVLPEAEGYVTAIDTRSLGLSVVHLGGGRTRAEDSIDASVGLEDVISLGATSDHPLAVIHAQSEEAWNEAAATIRAAVTFDDAPVSVPPVIHEIIR